MRKLLIALLLFITTPCLAFGPAIQAVLSAGGAAAANPMKQKFLSGEGSLLSTAADRYLNVVDGRTDSVENEETSLIPVAGTIRNLRVRLSVAPDTGAGVQSYVILVRTASGASAMGNSTLTCTIADAATTCSDTEHSFTVAADDKISIQVTPSGTPTAAKISTMLEFQGNIANRVALTASTNVLTVTDATTKYVPIHGGGLPGTSDVGISQCMPITGTIKAFYLRQTAAVGAGVSRTYTILKNGGDEATSSLTLNDDSTLAASVSNLNIAVTAGDVFSIRYVNTGTIAAAFGFLGILFEPTTNGQFPIMSSSAGATIAGGETVYLPQSSMQDIAAAEALFNAGYDDYTITGMFAVVSVAPAGEQTVTITPRVQTGPGDASNPPACTITGAELGCSSTGTITPAQFEGYDTKVVLSATAATTRIRTGYIGYIAP